MVMTKRKPKQLGQILLEQGLITNEQLETARVDHRSTARSLGRTLIDLAYTSARAPSTALAQPVGLALVDLSDPQIDPIAATLLPEQLARRYRALPIGERDGNLLVAM